LAQRLHLKWLGEVAGDTHALALGAVVCGEVASEEDNRYMTERHRFPNAVAQLEAIKFWEGGVGYNQIRYQGLQPVESLGGTMGSNDLNVIWRESHAHNFLGCEAVLDQQ
jgi:hypothetical protein